MDEVADIKMHIAKKEGEDLELSYQVGTQTVSTISFWRISLFVTDDAVAKLYCMRQKFVVK